MRTYTSIFSLALLFAFAFASSIATDNERHIEIFAWPLSLPKATSLAQVAYNQFNASVRSYKSLTVPANEEIVRIGFYSPSGVWSGIATAASNFDAGKDKKLQLHIQEGDGEIYHVGFKANEAVLDQKTDKDAKDRLAVEVIPIRPGPTPHLNKPVVVNQDGQVEGKEPEKTFLQKYWWAIGLFLVMQIAMSGGKEEEGSKK